MKLYELQIRDNTLSPVNSLDGMIAGDTSYIYFTVTSFDTRWTYATQKAIVFEYDKKEITCPLVNGSVNMPDEIAKQHYFKIRVIGLAGDIRLATNELFVEQEEV